jgi:hypothetical protein
VPCICHGTILSDFASIDDSGGLSFLWADMEPEGQCQCAVCST